MMDEWIRSSWLFQQEIFHQLGNRKWDDLEYSKENLLQKLEMPFQLCFGDSYRDFENIVKITEKVRMEIIKLFEERKYNENFACTFINIKMKSNNVEGKYCVFWLQNGRGDMRCLDLNGRNYESWQDFMENNVLPKCDMIFPKYGRYFHDTHRMEDFIDIMLEESEACSVGTAVKNVIDVISTVGGMAAAGVLVFNPVGASVVLGAGAVSVATGLYSVGNSVNKLVDIHKRDGGLSLTDSKTLLTVGELVITAAGTAAVGAASGIKGIAAKTGTVLSEGSIAYKLANNMTKVTRIVSAINAGFYIVVAVDKYNKEGHFTKKDLLLVTKIIFFSCNAFVTVELLETLISYLANSFTLQRIIDHFVSSPQRCVSIIRKVHRFCSSTDLNALIEFICPDFARVYLEKISNIIPLVQRAAQIADRTLSLTRNKNKNDMDYIEYIYILQKDLRNLWNDVSSYKKKSEKQLSKKFDKDTLMNVKEWTRGDGIDLNKDNSKFDLKLNTPVKIKEKIAETIDCCRQDDSVLREQREKEIFSDSFKFVRMCDVKDHDYIMAKINFYCDNFQSIYRTLMDLYHYEFFLYKINADKPVSKSSFFRTHYNTSNIKEYIFNETFMLLKQQREKFHEEFENNFMSNPVSNRCKERIVYDFEMPCPTPGLAEEYFYSIAKEKVPKFRTKLNKISTTFDYYDDLGLAVIKSKENVFTLFFYVVVENGFVKGILLFDEHV